MVRLATFCVAAFIAGLAPAKADRAFKLPLCEDEKASGWSFYCTREEPEEAEPEKEPTPAPTPPVEQPVAEKGPATQAMMAFRAKVDEIKYRAVLDPTPENVKAYMVINKQIAEQAGHFTDQWQRVLFSTPELDANVDYPLTATGINVYQDQLKAAREATLRKVAANQGIMFIFEDSARCGTCRVQGEVLAQMEKMYGVGILPVSRDGGQNESYPNAVADSGKLKQMGLEEYPSPTIALVDPQNQDVQVIGSGLLTADQILERVYVVEEVPVGERY